MKPFFISLFVMFCLPLLTGAQTIHGIIFAATDDPKIGEGMKRDHDRALEEINDIGAYIGYKTVIYDFPGSKCKKQNLMNVLNSMNTGKDDIVVFYYSGHGAHSKHNLNEKWPQMCLSEKDHNNWVPVRVVDEQLSKKPHRIRLILSDCCNVIDETGILTAKSIFDNMNTVTVVRGDVSANYKRLFLDKKGKIMATGSILGTPSFGPNSIGGFFSLSFWESLYNECSQGNAPSWSSVKKNTEKRTQKWASDFGQQNGDPTLKQTPYIEVNISDLGSSSNVSTISTPQPPVNVTPVTSSTSFSESVTSLLGTNNTDARLNLAKQILKQKFSGGGYVLTLGRDLKTEIDFEKIDVFLKRLVSSQSIIKINVIEESKTNDGKPYITVTEVRKGY